MRIYSICKPNQKEEVLSKFDYLKSRVQNKCTLEKDISSEEFEEKDEFDFRSAKSKEGKEEKEVDKIHPKQNLCWHYNTPSSSSY